MSRLPGSLAFVLPPLVKLLRGPGKFFLAVSALACVLLAFVSYTPAMTGAAGAIIFLAVAVIGLIAIVVFSIRGAQLISRIDESGGPFVSTGGTEIIPAGEPVSEDEVYRARFENARLEADVKNARFFPRVESAQRAAIAAAGGVAHAPYLKADLRITLVAGMIAMGIAPLAFFLTLLAALLY